VADFTSIKLPTIYYHLGKMEREGLVSASRETEGTRPERTVFTVTQKGQEAFIDGLERQLTLTYQPIFDADALFYFADHLNQAQMLQHLAEYVTLLERSLTEITSHLQSVSPYVPENQQVYVKIIFDHHTLHYQAEKTWAQATIESLLAGGKADAQATDH
jgi:DNA-binding PadR family transcriptional regulator